MGVFLGRVGDTELRHEEPINGRKYLTDPEILGMVNAALSGINE